MGAIAGWVDFHRDPSRDQRVIHAMTANLACRGRGDELVWTDNHIALGQRNSVPGAAGNPGFAVTEADGKPYAALAYDGQVYNLRSLKEKLQSFGEPLAGSNDAEILLRAYLVWGEDCASHLDGMFAIVVWDARRNELFLIRDRLGVKPLYYYRTENGVVFGSEIKALLAHPFVEAVADHDSLRELFAFTWTQGHGLFKNMHKLHPGSIVRFRQSGPAERRYWRLEARPHSDDLGTTVSKTRGLLEDAVARCLNGADDTVLLSGGIDSSSVAALAQRVHRVKGWDPVRTYTVGFDAAADRRSGASSSDIARAAEVAEWLGTDHTEIQLEPADMIDPVTRFRRLSAQQDLPTPACAFPTALRLLCSAVSGHTNTTLSGQRADNLFGGLMGTDDPAVLESQTFPWVAFMQFKIGGSGLGTGLFSSELLTELNVPGYCAERYRDDLAKVPSLPGEGDEDRRMREIIHLFLGGLFEWASSLDEGAASTSGLEVRWPFCDHNLVEYTFNVPWRLKSVNGQGKSLLRSAVSDLLPESVVTRPQVPFPIGQHPGYTQFLREKLSEILTDSRAPVRPLLDPQLARTALEDPGRTGNPWQDTTDIEMVLQMNEWLGEYGVHLSL